MPELTFYCVLCGASIKGNESFYGTEFSCPACNARVLIPRRDPHEASAPHPAPQFAPQPAPSATRLGPAREQPVASFSPVLRAHAGRLLLAILLVLASLVVLVLLPHHSPWNWYGATALFLVAFIFFIATLWKCKSVRYELSTQRLTIVSGLLSTHVDELELFRVKDVLVSQNVWQRMLNYGSVTVLSTDDTTPRLTIANIRAPLQAKELLRDAYREARRAAGLRTTEFIQS